VIERQLLYGGSGDQQRSNVHVVPWNMASTVGWER
jgi:hypothetical protein